MSAKRPRPIAMAPKPDLSVETEPSETFLPVTHFSYYTNAEWRVIDHPAVQRLGEIRQLGLSHLLFRGATHSRLEHSFGTCAVAELICQAIARNHGRTRNAAAADLAEPLSSSEVSLVRLAALLHDVGHLPMSHTIEDEFHLLDRHDGAARVNLVLDRTEWPSGNVPPLRHVIDSEYEFLRCDLSPSELLLQTITRPAPALRADQELSVRLPVCREIVGDTICADLLDYLHRDWYHIGKPKFFDTRILQYMEVRRRNSEVDAFVVSVGERPRVRGDAITGILDLLESRYQLAEIVLYHRTKLALAAIFERGLHETYPFLTVNNGDNDEASLWRARLVERALDVTDVELLDGFIAEADKSSPVGAGLLRRVRGRRVYKNVHTRFFEELTASVASRLARIYGEGAAGACHRVEAARLLEHDLNLPFGSVVLYVPDADMNMKRAGVNVWVDGQIETLELWERRRNNPLAGGHLGAQLLRFHRLWRLHVFVDPALAFDETEAKPDPEREARWFLLKDVISQLVFAKKINSRHLMGIARDLARRAAALGVHSDSEDAEIAAQGAYAKRDTYPSGAPCLRSFRSHR